MRNMNNCKKCDEPLVDVNEHTHLLRFGPPSFECQNPECSANPYAKRAKQSVQESNANEQE